MQLLGAAVWFLAVAGSPEVLAKPFVVEKRVEWRVPEGRMTVGFKTVNKADATGYNAFGSPYWDGNPSGARLGWGFYMTDRCGGWPWARKKNQNSMWNPKNWTWSNLPWNKSENFGGPRRGPGGGPGTPEQRKQRQKERQRIKAEQAKRKKKEEKKQKKIQKIEGTAPGAGERLLTWLNKPFKKQPKVDRPRGGPGGGLVDAPARDGGDRTHVCEIQADKEAWDKLTKIWVPKRWNPMSDVDKLNALSSVVKGTTAKEQGAEGITIWYSGEKRIRNYLQHNYGEEVTSKAIRMATSGGGPGRDGTETGQIDNNSDWSKDGRIGTKGNGLEMIIPVYMFKGATETRPFALEGVPDWFMGDLEADDPMGLDLTIHCVPVADYKTLNYKKKVDYSAFTNVEGKPQAPGAFT